MKIVSRATIGSAALWLVLLLLSVTSVSAQSTKVSTQTGDWYFGSTWIGGVPPADGDHIIISAGHVVNFIGSITVTNLTVSGTLIVGEPGLASTLTVLGSTNITTGGTLTAGTTPATHTAIFNGTVLANGQFHLNPGAGRIINPTFRSNVTINGLGSSSESTVTFDGATTLIGMSNFSNVLITGQLTSTSMTVTGNWTMNAGGSFNPGAGTVHFTGNNAAINGTALTHSFNNVVINKTSGQTLSTSGSITSMAVAGNLTLSQGSLAAPALLTVAGNITQTPGILIAGANIELGGNWTGGATFVHNSGTVTMTGSASQSFSTGTPTLYNLIINKDAGSTFTSVATSFTLTVAHHFTLLEGTYSLPGGMMNVGSDWIHQGGTFTHTGAASYVAFNGSGVQQITSSTLTSETFQSFRTLGSGSLSVGGTINTINTLGGVTMSSTKIFNAPATLNIGTDLIMNGGQLVAGSLTDVKGNWTINGGTFTSGTGTVAFTGTGAQTISGTITTQLFNNVTINKTAGQTLTVGGSATTLTIQGDFTQTQGNFTSMASGTINVAGNWTHDAGTSSITAGIVFNGTGSQSISSTSLTSLTFAHFSVIKPFGSTLITGGTITSMTVNNYLCINGSFTPPAALTINGDASLSSGTLNAGALIDIKGNWTSSLPPNFSAGTGTVTFTGSGSQAINGGSAAHLFNNLTINKPAGQVLSVSGSATMLSIQNFTQTQGDFTPMSGGTIQVYGNWTHTAGIFTPGTATVMFNGSGSSQISSASATISYFHLTVNKTGVLSTGGSITNLVVGGDLSMWGGILSSPGNIDIAGNWDVSGGGFDPGTGTVRFNGAANQFINNGSSSPVWFNNLTVNMTAGMLLTTTGTVSEITLSGNYNQITGNVAAPSTITISGNWTQSAGTFSPGVGTVMFIGGNTQSINTTSPTFYNITVSKVGALSLSPATYNILNDLTITQGLFTVGSSTINVGGNWTRNGGLFLGIGTVTFNGSGAQLITSSALTSETFSSVSVNKSAGTLAAGGTITSLAITGNLTLTQGTLTAPALLTVTGNITHTSGNLVAGANIELSGNWTNGAFFVHSSGTVTMTGGSPQSFSLGTPAFHDLTINKTAGSTFTSVAVGVTVTVAHNFTLLAGTYSLPGGMMNVGGDWIHEGGAFTHTGAAGYVAFNGSVAQQITSSTLTSESFQSFRTVNSGSLSVGGTITTINTVGGLNLFNTKIFNAPATLNIGTDLTMNGGQLVAGSLINVGGNWPQSGGTFTPGTGTVVFNGTGAQTITSNAVTQTFYNLTVNKTAATLLNTGGSIATLTIQGDYTQTSGNFTAPTNLNLGGNWNHTAGTFTSGTNTSFTGSGTQVISSSTLSTVGFTNVTINKTPVSLLQTGGIVATLNVSNYSQLNGDFAPPANLGVSGNWVHDNGSFNTGTGTVSFSGGASSISGTAPDTFFHMTLNKGAGQTLTVTKSALVVGGNYTQSTGNFGAPATFTVAGNVSNAATNTWTAGALTYVGGNWTASAFTPGTGTVVFNGAGTQSMATPLPVLNNLTIDKAAGSTLTAGNATLTVANYTQTSGNLTLSGGNMNVTGNWLYNGGTFTQSTGTVNLTGNSSQISSSSQTTLTFGHLTVAKTAAQTLSVGGTLTDIIVTGDLSNTSGNFNAPQTLAVAGNWGTGGVFVPGTGTVVFNGSGTQSFLVLNFYNLTINKSAGTLTGLTGATYSVLNDLTLSQGTLTCPGTTNLFIGGNWIKAAGTASAFTVTFNGSGSQQITASSATTEGFTNLTINKPSGSITVGGTLTGITAVNFAHGGSGTFTAPPSMTMSGAVTHFGGTWNAGNTTQLQGNWTMNGGTFVPGAGTVTFTGSSSSITGSASPTFNNLVINKPAGQSLSVTAALVITNNFTQSSGDFNASTVTLNVGGDMSIGTGSFTAPTTLTLNGSGPQVISRPSASVTFGIVTVNKTGGSNVTFGGSLTTVTVTNYNHTLGTVTLPATTTVNGNTTLSAGTLVAGSLIDVKGNWSIASGFTFNPGTGTVTFTGSGTTMNGSSSSATFFNLTINKPATTLTIGGTITTLSVLGNYTQTAGNLTLPAASNFNLGGNWSHVAGNFIHGTGSLILFNGSGTQTMTSTSEIFENMSIVKPSGLLNAGALSTITTGNFSHLSGDFTAPNSTLFISGNYIRDGGVLNPGAGFISFNGGGPQSIGSSSLTTLDFYGLETIKTGGSLLSLSGSVTTINVAIYAQINGNFAAPPTFNAASDIHLSGGTMTSGALIDVKGNFNFTGGILSPGTGTVSFTGTGPQACTGGTFYNFTVNKSTGSTLTTSTTVSIAHDFTLLEGNVTLSGTLSLTGNWMHDQGTVTGSGGVTFTGAGTQVISSSTRTSDFLGALTVNKSGGSLSVTGTITALDLTGYTNTLGTFNAPATMNVAGNVTLTAGTVTAGNLIMVTGNWTNNAGTFNHETGTVNFNGPGAQTINGSATSQTFYNFTVNKSAATLLNVGGSTTTVNVQNNYTQTQGNFTGPAAMFIRGNWAHAAGTFTPPTTILFTGPNNQVVSSSSLTNVSFASLLINKLAGSLLQTGGIVNTMTVTGYTQLNGDFTPPNLFIVNGNWSHDFGTFNAGSGTVQFGAGGTTSIGGSGADTFNHLTLAKTTGTTLTSKSPLTIAGNFSQVTGNLAAPSILVVMGNVSIAAGNTWTAGAQTQVGGDWTGSAFTPGTGTVLFNGPGAQTINTPLPVFNNLTIDKASGTVTVGNALLTVGGFFDQVSGNFALTGGNMNVSSHWFYDGGTFTPSTGTVTLIGNSSLITSLMSTSTSFGHLTVAKTAGQTLTVSGTLNSITVNGNFSQTSGNFTAPATFTINGNATLNTTGTFTAGSLVDLKGNLTITAGTFAHNSGTLAFTGTGAQSFPTATTYYNLTVNKPSGAISFPNTSSFIVANNFTLTQGDVTATGATINLGGNWTHNAGLMTGAPAITFNGTGPQLIQSSLLSSESFSTVHVNKTAGSLLSVGGTMATINLAGYSQTQGNFAAPGTLNIAGPVLLTAGTFTAGNLITVAGNWTNNGATVVPGTGTVNFTGVSAQVINGTAVTQSIGVLLKTGSSALTIAGSTTTLNVTGYTNSLGSFTAPATFNVSGNVTLSSGTFTAGTNMSVSRNWNSNGGSFIPGSNTVTFNSTNAQQIIGGTQAAGFGRLTINNTHSASPQVSVNTPVIVGTQLTLTSGIVQTDLTNVFQLGNGVIVTGGSSASHISGPMQYVAVANGVTAALNFPVGKGGNYGHVLLNVRHTNASSYVYTTEVIQSPASGLGYALAAGTDRVSGARYWNVRRGALATPLVTDNTNLATGVNAPTIRLTYASVDGVLDLPNLTMVKNVNGGTTWFDIGGTASGTPAGTINMTVPSANFDGFSNFALANKTNGNNLQPLPAITSLSPSFGPIGTTVLINGSSFDQTLANNVVYFGATRATVTAAQPSQLTVTVPAGATYQPVSVMVGGLTAYGSPFTVTIANSNVIDAYSFGPKVDISANPNGKDNIIADIDNDGKPDVVVVTSSSSLSVFRNTSTTGSPSFASHVDLSAGGTPTSVDAGDIDGDGKLDLVATSATANTVTILKNQSTPGTISFATNVNFTTGGTPSSVAIADLNDDFRPDLVVANYADNTVSLFRNVTLTGVISLSSFSAKVDYNTGAGPQSVAIADIDADGKRDVIVANKDDATVSILKNAMSAGAFSSGSLALQVAFSTGNTPVDLAIADFDGDGKPDVASANFVSNTVSIRKNVTSTGVINGTSFEPAIHFAVGTNPRGIAVTDLTGDGKPDIATTNQAGNSVSVLKNLSTTGVINNNSLDGKIDYSTATGPHSIFIGDLEGDGRPDLLVSHNASSILSVIRHKLYQQITFNALSAKTYGDTDFPPTASSSSSLAIAYQTDNDDVAEIAGSDLHIVGAGTVNVTAIQAGNNTYGQAVAVMRPLSVSKAQLTVTADDANRLYGNPNPALIVSYSGFVGADDESEIDADPTAGTTATMFDNIGDYPITITGGSDNNYDFTLVDGTLTVNQKPLTVIADNKTRSYGVANPAFTISYDGLASWDDPSNLDVEPAASSTATQSSNIGIYPITFDDGEDANYDISFVDGSLTIGKANLTVTANDASKTYGTTNPVFSWTYSGFHGADDETDLDTQPTASTSAGQLNDVGTYQITLSGGTDDNYAFTLVNGTLTIGKAELSVTANNATRVYGAADPAFSLSYSGLAPGDQPSVVDSPPTASTSATQFSNTGTYPIALSGGTDNNYTFNLTAGTLTVGKALLIVTSDSKTKKFGEPNPLFTATYSGFLGTDDASVIDTPPTLASTNQFMDPGTYPITVLGAADNNYMMTAVLGTLTIEKAILTATAQNASRIFGAANPPLTITYSGFAGLDDPNNLGTKPTASTTATVDSAPGVYPISASGGADTHYAFNYVNGQLTVTKAAQTISFATLANRQFGDATFQLTAASPAGPVTFTSSDVSVATVAGNTVTIAGVGSTTITATQGGNNFYEAGSATQLLTVVKGSQTISFTAITDKKMGDTSFSLTANASSGLAVTLTGSDHVSLAGLQVTLMKPGRASIAANQAGNNIYNAAPAVTQTFCINPAKPTVTLSNANTPNPILTSSGTEGSLWYLNGSPLPNQTANTLTISTSGIYRVQSKVDDCSGELSDPVVIIITGLFDAETAGIRSYPNPVDDVLEVSGLPSDPDESRAFDMSGRPIPLFFQRAGDVHRTSVGHLPSGLYLVRIKIGAVSYQVKMIKL